MSQPGQDEPRELLSPVKFFDPRAGRVDGEMDLTPKVVRSDDVLPTEAGDVVPKAEDLTELSVQESVGTSLEPAKGPESSVPVTKENSSLTEVPGLEDLERVSPEETNPGENVPPVVTPPLPPAATRSSRSAAKSA
jgi:hypothetical protein